MAGNLNLNDFDYHLPPELIAQEPAAERDQSRLLVMHRDRPPGRDLEHRSFSDFPQFLRSGDCLVLNDTRVMAARLTGTREPGGGRAEVLFLSHQQDGRWRALLRRRRRFPPGVGICLADGLLRATVLEHRDGGEVVLDVHAPYQKVMDVMALKGEMPLPPYIKESPSDPDRYQTVYAREGTSVAAPTAGLHFTPALLNRVRKGGINTSFVTLDVGEGTFRPVQDEAVTDHRMHPESFEIGPGAARAINTTRKRGGQVVAVGTTVVRTLESMAGEDGCVEGGAGTTDLFIYPGYQFRAVDRLVTNFHLPRSTLLMLVAAFAGRERVLRAYQEAIKMCYRFYSFGDAMLIL